MFGELGLGVLNKELGDLSFLKNEDFGYWSEGIEFSENLFVVKLEDDSLVDTN